jgi:nucleotide-binding universal stress UspA family protein
VLQDHLLEQALGGEPDHTARQLATGAQSVLGWVEQLAAARGVGCETVLRGGEPFREILAEADACGADVIVIGRSDRRGPRSPYLGSVTAHVLEFTEVPVLVVPHTGS